MALLDAMDGALRHAEEAAEFGLTPAERRARHAHRHRHQQTVALLTIAMLTVGFASDRDVIRVGFGESPLHRTLSKAEPIPTKGIPQAAGAAWGLQRFMIACAAVMIIRSWIEVVLNAHDTGDNAGRASRENFGRGLCRCEPKRCAA